MGPVRAAIGGIVAGGVFGPDPRAERQNGQGFADR